MRRYSVSTTIKSSGDGEVATVAGEGCRWKLLVTTLHVGGPGVTVVWSSTLESRCHMYPVRTSEQPCLGVALLSPVAMQRERHQAEQSEAGDES